MATLLKQLKNPRPRDEALKLAHRSLQHQVNELFGFVKHDQQVEVELTIRTSDFELTVSVPFVVMTLSDGRVFVDGESPFADPDSITEAS